MTSSLGSNIEDCVCNRFIRSYRSFTGLRSVCISRFIRLITEFCYFFISLLWDLIGSSAVPGVLGPVSGLVGGAGHRYDVWEERGGGQRLYPAAAAAQRDGQRPDEGETGFTWTPSCDLSNKLTILSFSRSETDDAAGPAGRHALPHRPLWPHPPALSANQLHPCVGSGAGPQQVRLIFNSVNGITHKNILILLSNLCQIMFRIVY